MYKYIITLSFLLLVGCKENRICVVKGGVPSTEYDGEIVYLVPVRGATAGNVDSTYIRNGAFRFELDVAQGADIRIIRTRPILRLRLQELLVVVEPGEMAVKLDSVSRAGGTLANDALQTWKEEKMRVDEATGYLQRLLHLADDSLQIKEIQEGIERVSADYSTFNYTFVKENKGNTAGRFVYGMIKQRLNPEQRNELDIEDGD